MVPAALVAGTATPLEGKVIVAAFTDSYNNIVRAVRNYKAQEVQGGLGTGGGLGVQGGFNAGQQEDQIAIWCKCAWTGRFCRPFSVLAPENRYNSAGTACYGSTDVFAPFSWCMIFNRTES